jgi:DNA-directed RNA polymerase subunit RPC12/RpoP
MSSYKCVRCGHEWKPRFEQVPKCCPACKSYRFAIPRKMQPAKEIIKTDDSGGTGTSN